MPFDLFTFDLSASRAAIVVLVVAGIASFDLLQRFSHHRPTHYIFACLLGTLLALGLAKVGEMCLQPAETRNPYLFTLGLLFLILGWKSLFGPWESQTKAAVLGTFLFWLLFRFFSHETPEQRPAHLFAAAVALVPAIIWCILFLKYHRERLSVVLLMFFAGMLSTLPVLVYDALVRTGASIDLFLLKITPESFNRASQTFVQGQLSLGGVQTTLAVSLVSFLFVGVLEELSKMWMVRRNGVPLFSSIDDAMQLSIMVAIGFAFAENVVNPSYFLGFVRDHLLRSGTPDVVAFFSNVTGRAVLTSMVHIVSTGVMGYFLGLALFADPYLRESEERGRHHRFLHAVSRLLRLEVKSVYRTEMMIVGLAAAIVLHGAFNFMVTLPDLLPGQPTTIGEALRTDIPVLRSLPILLFPALFYVLGGFWLLTGLFLRAENAKERGRVVQLEAFVPATN
jgi:RsiW-degrading membrane proteinase PrsW (M82 family)